MYCIVDDFGVITPEIYKNNPFRILDLPFNPSNNDINKSFGNLKIKMHQNKSLKRINDIIPIIPPPDKETIEKAHGYLDDPKIRFIYEFFWFWPMDIDNLDGEDEAFKNLFKNLNSKNLNPLNSQEINPLKSQEIWMDNEKNIIASHNLAILDHIFALDNELNSAKKKPDRQWKNAYERWNYLLSQPELLDIMKHRIELLKDPLIKPSYAQEVFAMLPEALLSINASFIAYSVENGGSAGISRHVKIMQNSSFSEDLINKMLEKSIEPARKGIESLISNAEAGVKKASKENPEEIINILKNLIKEVKPVLNSINLVLPTSNIFSKNLHEKTAKMINVSSNMLLNSIKDESNSEIQKYDHSLKFLETANELAVNELTHKQIEEDIQKIKQEKELVPLISFIKEMDKELRDNPEDAIKILYAGMDLIESLVEKASNNLTDKKTLDNILDNVAIMIFGAVISKFNSLQNNPAELASFVDVALNYLDKALKIARTDKSRSQIKENIKIIGEQRERIKKEKDLIPLMNIITEIDEELRDNPEGAIKVLYREMDQIESLVEKVSKNFLDKDTLNNILDNVAMVIFGAVIAKFNSLQDDPAEMASFADVALNYLDKALKIARTDKSRSQIKENIKIIKGQSKILKQRKYVSSLMDIVKKIDAELNFNPKYAINVLYKRMDQIESLVDKVSSNLKDKKALDNILDNVAMAIFSAVIAKFNSLQDDPAEMASFVDVALNYLDKALKISRTDVAKGPIKENIKTIKEQSKRLKAEKDLVPLMDIVQIIQSKIEIDPNGAYNLLSDKISKIKSLLKNIDNSSIDKKTLNQIHDNTAFMIINVIISYHNWFHANKKGEYNDRDDIPDNIKGYLENIEDPLLRKQLYEKIKSEGLYGETINIPKSYLMDAWEIASSKSTETHIEKIYEQIFGEKLPKKSNIFKQKISDLITAFIPLTGILVIIFLPGVFGYLFGDIGASIGYIIFLFFFIVLPILVWINNHIST